MSELLDRGRKLSEFREYFGKELIRLMDSRPDVNLEDLADCLKDVFGGISRGTAKNAISKYRAGKLHYSWKKRVPYILQFYDVESNDEIVLRCKEIFPNFVYPPAEIKEKYCSLNEKMKLLTADQKKELEQVGKIEDLTPDEKNEFELTVDYLIKENKKNKK